MAPIPPWVLGFRGSTLPRSLGRAIADGRVSGLILFRDNLGGSVASALDLRREISSLVPPGRPFLLMADEEGGLISQTSGLALPSGAEWPSVPTPRALGRIGRLTGTRGIGRLLGRRLRALGITVDLAPCLDLDTERMNPVIGSRSFGSDPEGVAALGAAFAAGLADAGVAACFKHFPGHGGTRLDSHLSLPEMDAAQRRLHEAPFRLALRSPRVASSGASRSAPRRARLVPWVMSAHVDWGGGVPASLDPGVLKAAARWSPRSLIITDSLDMGAVDLAHGAAERALLAGNDVLLIGRDCEAGLEAIARLNASVKQDPTLRAAYERSGRRVAAVWNDLAGSTLAQSADASARPHGAAARGARKDDFDEAAERDLLKALHLSAVGFDHSPAGLPKGAWAWIVPEGLAPYVRLREWAPVRGRRRPCEEVLWVPERATAGWLQALARRLREETRPVLVATLFRGMPAEQVRKAWEPLVRLPGLAVIAHLLDEAWPGATPSEKPGGPDPAPIIALTSGPSRQALTGLAEALDRAL